MKLPFEFGTKLIFRLVFPGAALAVAMMPLVNAVLAALNVNVSPEIAIPIEIVGWGWLIALSDMHIYMIFEGRRYWPTWLRTVLTRQENERLHKLDALAASTVTTDRRRYLEASVESSYFPVRESGEPYAEHPTRLGNLIESYERYPRVKYGLDAVFFWYRIWVSLDKDLRDEIDTAQSVVDSSVYISFTLYLSGVLAAVYALLRALPVIRFRGITLSHAISLAGLPSELKLLWIAVACFVAGYLLYRLSLPAHAQFGELFKSIFDQFRTKLAFDDIFDEVIRITNKPELRSKSFTERNVIIWRYLRWHRIRDDAQKRNFTIGEWNKRRIERTHDRSRRVWYVLLRCVDELRSALRSG